MSKIFTILCIITTSLSPVEAQVEGINEINREERTGDSAPGVTVQQENAVAPVRLGEVKVGNKILTASADAGGGTSFAGVLMFVLRRRRCRRKHLRRLLAHRQGMMANTWR